MQHHPHKSLNTVWLKAAVVGSIWASLEIILGSFLHNLKVPITGTVLSFIGVYLLVAFNRIWDDKGMIWRAGLICALMKSISPSAIILGPMIGIFCEALLVEIFVRFTGRNIISYSIGGGLAVFTTIVQTAIGLIVLYGFNFVKILASLYQFSLKQINLPQLDVYYLLLLITAMYVTAGAIAAIAGNHTGKKYLLIRNKTEHSAGLDLTAENKLFTISDKQKYSLLFLILNILAVVLCLFLINMNFSFSSVFIVMAYVLFCFNFYKGSLKHVAKISFWVQFILITLAAGYFLNGLTKGNFLTYDGLITGLKMNLRAIIIITGFSAISTELRNPLIKSVLYKKGFSNIYQALSLAFAALPGIVAWLPMPNELIRKPFNSFVNLVNHAQALLIVFQNELQKRPVVFVISGEIGGGKSTYAKKVVELLKEKGINISGFLSPGVQVEGKRIGFDICDVKSGNGLALCRNTGNESWLRIGNYFFTPNGLDFGNELLKKENVSDSQIIIVDELGILEVNNSGWAKPVGSLCRETSIPQIWIVRKKLVERVIKKWNVGDVFVFDIKEDPEQVAAECILNLLAKMDVVAGNLYKR